MGSLTWHTSLSLPAKDANRLIRRSIARWQGRVCDLAYKNHASMSFSSVSWTGFTGTGEDKVVEQGVALVAE
jgi:hypothetical protein